MKLKFLVLVTISLLLIPISESLAQSQITISTDKASYDIGDIVNISGTITAAENFPVAIEVKDASGDTIVIRTAQTDSNGRFDLSFKVPSDASPGSLTIIATANISGQTITQTNSVLLSEQSAGGGCLIATATFGSELAPQVQQLRELRDNALLQTNSGTAFMSGFNQFYYSFSPTIADWERENTVFKEIVKVAITPLLTSLSILNYVDMDSEAEVLGYGISLIFLNVGMYFVLPAFVSNLIRKKMRLFNNA